jgi:hypothetical protein
VPMYKSKKDNARYQREWYQRNKEKKKRQNKQRQEGMQALMKYNKHHAACVDCGVRYPHWKLDYDHVRGDKKFCLSRVGNKGSWRLFYEELDKCEIVCANCHRGRTYKRRVPG